MQVIIESYEGEPLSVQLPDTVDMEVVRPTRLKGRPRHRPTSRRF